jgi:hypothetical protein
VVVVVDAVSRQSFAVEEEEKEQPEFRLFRPNFSNFLIPFGDSLLIMMIGGCAFSAQPHFLRERAAVVVPIDEEDACGDNETSSAGTAWEAIGLALCDDKASSAKLLLWASHRGGEFGTPKCGTSSSSSSSLTPDGESTVAAARTQGAWYDSLSQKGVVLGEEEEANKGRCGGEDWMHGGDSNETFFATTFTTRASGGLIGTQDVLLLGGEESDGGLLGCENSCIRGEEDFLYDSSNAAGDV